MSVIVTEPLKAVDILAFPGSLQATVRYSYNYNQELHYPADPYQPSMIFFKPYWRSLPHLSALLYIS